MATPRRRGRNWILTVTYRGRRTTLTLGPIGKVQAESVAANIDAIRTSHRTFGGIPDEAAAWLETAPARISDQLRDLGLVTAADKSPTIDNLIARFADHYAATHARPSTKRRMRCSLNRIPEWFRELPADAVNDTTIAKLAAYLHDNYAAATVSRTGRDLKQVGLWAERNGLIESTPFRLFPTPGERNPGRQSYIEIATIQHVIAVTADSDIRTVLALARFAGLRIPSEIVTLAWRRVDLTAGILTADNSKAATGTVKQIPIFPVLRDVLAEQYELTAADSGYVVTPATLRKSPAALANATRRAIRHAGVTPWPKLFQNLRASCETDLMSAFPIHQATSWIGNTPAVALKHYAMLRPHDVSAAIRRDPFGQPDHTDTPTEPTTIPIDQHTDRSQTG